MNTNDTPVVSTPYDHDSHLERNRAGRFLFFVATVLVVVGVPTWLGIELGNALDFFGATYIFGTIGFNAGVYVMIRLFPKYWVSVPQTMAFVTTNMLSPEGGNPNIPYGPGGHFAFPWEQREESGNITLDTLTVRFTIPVPTKTAQVTVHGSLQFKFGLQNIVRVVELDASAIQDGFIDMVNEFISEKVSEMNAEQARSHIKELRKDISEHFMETVKVEEELLRKFNAIIEGVQISNIELPADVQTTRDSIEEARAVGESLWRVMGFSSKKKFETARSEGKISQADINRATEQYLAMSKNATLSISRIDATGVENANLGAGVLAGLVGSKKS